MKRIHISIDKLGETDAGLFIVSSLLVSHGVRTDAEAWVNMGRLWLIVDGSRVRQLRPDSISAEAWVRAVIRKGKAEKLGARLVPSIDIPSGPCVGPRGGRGVDDVVADTIAKSSVIVLKYSDRCDEAGFNISGMRIWMAPALANILIDRIASGLPP